MGRGLGTEFVWYQRQQLDAKPAASKAINDLQRDQIKKAVVNILFAMQLT